MSARIIVVIAVAMLLGCGSRHADDRPHIKRARELMSIGEWASARSELKIDLKAHPRDVVARGLLLYCVYGLDGVRLGAGDIGGPNALLELQTILSDSAAPSWEATAPAELREQVARLLIVTRQALYDAGVDTKDSPDLAQVLLAAARWGFESDDVIGRKDRAAAILAIAGDQAASAHLIERLKSRESDEVVEHLVRAGASMIPALEHALADSSFIGRRAALTALSRIQAAAAAAAFTAPRRELRDPLDVRGADVPDTITGLERLGPNFLRAGRAGGARAHAQFAPLDGDVADGVLLLQSYDSSTRQLVARLMVFRGGRLEVVQARKAEVAFELGGSAVLFDLAATSPGRVVVHRLRETVTSHDAETGSVARPAVGMRVRLRGYEPHGEIVRADDGGLWVVRVEAPIEGLTELSVPASALIGLRAVSTTEITVETITAKLTGDRLEVETLTTEDS